MVLLVSLGMIVALLAYFIVRVGWHKRANAALQAGQLDEALAQYTRIIKYYPQDAIAMYNRAIAYRYKGDFQAALDQLDRAIARGGRMSALLHISRAYLHLYLGNHQAALDDYHLALHAEPNNPQALLGIILVYLFMEDYQTALQEAERVIPQIEADRRKHQQYSPYILTHTPDTQKRLDRIYEAIHVTKALALMKLGQIDEAFAIFDQLKAQNPTSSHIYVDSGEVHFQLGNYAAAKTDFVRAMQLEAAQPSGMVSISGYPFMYQVQAGYILSLFANGEVDEARNQLRDLQAKAPRLVTVQDFAKEFFWSSDMSQKAEQVMIVTQSHA